MLATALDWGLAVLSGALLSLGLIYWAGAFFTLALRSVGLLNIFLTEGIDEDTRHARVVGRLGGTVLALIVFVVYLGGVAVLSFAPIYLFTVVTGQPYILLEQQPVYFWLAFGLGSLLPLLLPTLRGSSASDYSPLSQLLHRLILGNYAVSRKLFRLEAARIAHDAVDESFVIVSGLARAGTTALCKMLAERGALYSLRYANVPFLMSPRLWAKIYRPRSDRERERSHGDSVGFGYNSVEALEEYFWKNMLDDAFITPGALTEHEVSAETYTDYLKYQQLVKPQDGSGGTYLAKNNNFILRYASLRSHNQAFSIICLIREPLDHASSLLKLHRRFSEQQRADPFVLEYMDWLGHHEFGTNHKPFRFDDQEEALPEGNPAQLDYWLHVWLNYYRRVATLVDDEKFYLLCYRELVERPAAVLAELSARIGVPLRTEGLRPFTATSTYDEATADRGLLEQCRALYEELQRYAV